MKSLDRTILVSSLCTLGLLSAGLAHAAIVHFHSNMSGTQEFPVNGSAATAQAVTVVDTDANTLSYTITSSGIVSETAAHIHGPAARGANAGVLIPLPAGNPKVGVWNYPELQEANILSGLMYYNIHTSSFPGGEIRGQIDHVDVPGAQPWQMAALAAALLVGGAAFVMRRRTA
jgi:hypothetical protein